MLVGLRVLPLRSQLLSQAGNLARLQISRSVRKSAFNWPQTSKRFPFEESFLLDDKRFTPGEVLDLLVPLVTKERLATLDEVRIC